MYKITCKTPEVLEISSLQQPEMDPGCALLRIHRVGICGTDLHAFKGNQPFFSYPRILGHELAAEVIDTGNTSSTLKSGDRVVVIPYINCEKCSACLAGNTNCCQNLKVFGVHTDGGMQEVITFPDRLLLEANHLTYDEIAITEPLAIGAHALRRAWVKKNEVVVVMGCGPIGMGIIQLAKYLDATVIAVDVNESRLDMAKRNFNADFVVNPKDNTAAERIRQVANGELAHVVIDATGNNRAIEKGVEFMRHGGRLVLVGLFKGDLNFHHPAIHAKETTILCSRNATREDFEFVLNVLQEKKFNTHAYITKSVHFKEIIAGFDSWSSPASKEIKVITEWR